MKTMSDEKGIMGLHESPLAKFMNVISCEGCVALTGGFLCDLGVKTEAIWHNGIRIGSRAQAACPRPKVMEDYLVEHLLKI
jgi:hypothetical protein